MRQSEGPLNITMDRWEKKELAKGSVKVMLTQGLSTHTCGLGHLKACAYDRK